MGNRASIRTAVFAACLACLGGASAAQAQGQTDEPPAVPHPAAEWRPLGEGDFLRTLATSARPLLVLMSSRYCDACPPVEAALAGWAERLAGVADLYTMELVDVSPGFADRYAVQGVPTLLVFLERELADVIVIFDVTEPFVQHVLTRNGLAEGGATFLADERERVGTMAVPEGSAFLAMDLGGTSLAGRPLRGVLFSGCGLRDVDMTGVDLTGAVFSRTDLTGANLSGAVLEGSRWINTICPDGTSSRDHGGTCAGHL